VHDPLVGRDVLAGLVAGVGALGLALLRTHMSGDVAPDMRLAIQALDSLRSVRHCMAVLVFSVLDGLNFALGALVLLTLIGVVVRKAWVAGCLWLVIAMSLETAGRMSFRWELMFAVPLAKLSLVVLLRIGLLSLAVMCSSSRAFLHLCRSRSIPNAWYIESSAIALLLIVALSVYGFVVATSDRPTAAKLSPAL
jgi:hypothetical protein